MSEVKFIYIRDITPAMKNVNLNFIVLDVGTPRRTRDGSEIRTVRIADKSGSVNLAVWNENGASLKPGDICRLINGYSCVHKSCLSVTCGKLGELQKIGEFTMPFNDYPFISVPNPELAKFDTPPQKRSPPQDGGGNSGSGGGGNAEPTTALDSSLSVSTKSARNANAGTSNGGGGSSNGLGGDASDGTTKTGGGVMLTGFPKEQQRHWGQQQNNFSAPPLKKPKLHDVAPPRAPQPNASHFPTAVPLASSAPFPPNHGGGWFRPQRVDGDSKLKFQPVV